MLDTKGPEIRTGYEGLPGADEEPQALTVRLWLRMLENGGTVALKQGQRLELTTDYSFLGNAEKIACSYADLPRSVAVGSVILVADGALALRVTEVQEEGVICEVENNAEIGVRSAAGLLTLSRSTSDSSRQHLVLSVSATARSGRT
eukprot:scaffold1883_cov261-Pinguiococcus_pyrenoidosus.AAC.9